MTTTITSFMKRDGISTTCPCCRGPLWVNTEREDAPRWPLPAQGLGDKLLRCPWCRSTSALLVQEGIARLQLVQARHDQWQEICWTNPLLVDEETIILLVKEVLHSMVTRSLDPDQLNLHFSSWADLDHEIHQHLTWILQRQVLALPVQEVPADD